MYARVLGVALVAHLALTSLVCAEEGSWVGKTIVIKEAKVKTGPKAETGNNKSGGELSATTYTVLEDRDGFLRVRDSGKSAWFPKSKAVLAENAVDYFTDLISQKPKEADLYKRRAAAWSLRNESAAAVKDLDEAIRLDPKGESYWNNRGRLFADRGEFDQAIKDYDESIRLKPSTVAFSNRANAYLRKEQPDRAIKDLDEAIRLDPDLANAYLNRGYIYATKNEYRKAIADYDEAIRSDPELVLAHNNKADALACCPDAKIRDGAKALEIAKTACKLSNYKDSVCLDTLACAYAEIGQFEEAIKWQTKAMEDPAYVKRFGEAAREHLRLFGEKKPFHYDEGPGNRPGG